MNKIGNGILQLAVKPVMKSVSRGSKKLFSTKYLLFTNTALTVGVSCAGDVVQQNYQILNKKLGSWDKLRTVHVSCTGFAIGPFCHYWYMYLDKWLPGRTLKVVFRKILIDQLVCSPVFIGTFLFTLCMMENAPWDKTKSDLIEKGKTLYVADWIIWPPAQLINFLFLPTKYRVLYDNSIAFGFDCYFSYVRYDKDYEHEKKTTSDSKAMATSVDVCEAGVDEVTESFEVVQSESETLCDNRVKEVSGNSEHHIFS